MKNLGIVDLNPSPNILIRAFAYIYVRVCEHDLYVIISQLKYI